MDPSTKPGAGTPPHEWRNRNYDETVEAKPVRRRWLQIAAALASLFMLFGLLWGVVKPLVE